GRFPELWGGESLPGDAAPLSFPTACSPQAWSSATAVSIMRTVLGLDVDAPHGRIVVSPMSPMPFGALSVRGLSIGGGLFDIEVDAHGTVLDSHVPEGYVLEVVAQGRPA
ncbi:MAG TPA: hypothetical protein VEX88_10550, partial [Glaciibacter sp.]|nr:hypothetical protein [Glaciibacter sp.]